MCMIERMSQRQLCINKGDLVLFWAWYEIYRVSYYISQVQSMPKEEPLQLICFVNSAKIPLMKRCFVNSKLDVTDACRLFGKRKKSHQTDTWFVKHSSSALPSPCMIKRTSVPLPISFCWSTHITADRWFCDWCSVCMQSPAARKTP